MTNETNARVSRLSVECEDRRSDYVVITSPEGAATTSFSSFADCTSIWWSFWWWGKLVFLVLFLAVLGFCFFVWIGPYVMEKEVIPILNWETETFSKPALAFIIFSSVAIFPTVFIPSTPSMWVAGMSFGYTLGFLLIMCGVTIGVSLPYFIGSLFYNKIQGWLERYPRKASVIRLAGEGDAYDQFRAVTLLRISPFPYTVYNYCAVATGVKYVPYFFGTLLGMLPDVFVAIYTGIMIRTLADASKEQRSLAPLQIVFTVCGFVITIVSTIIITVYAKKRLHELQANDEPLTLLQ